MIDLSLGLRSEAASPSDTLDRGKHFAGTRARSPGPGRAGRAVRHFCFREGSATAGTLGAGQVWGQRPGQGRAEAVRARPLGRPGWGRGPRLSRAPGPPGVGRRGVGRGGAAASSCPERGNNGEAVGEGHWEEGARVSRKGETKEPSTDCHLHVTRSIKGRIVFQASFCP